MLPPGDYAIVFGDDGLFGATGRAYMPPNNVDTVEGTNSYIHYSSFVSSWFDSPTIDNLRFTVNGNVVSVIGGEIIPIETTSLILASAQTFSWMIPVTLSVLGIGLFAFRKSENS